MAQLDPAVAAKREKLKSILQELLQDGILVAFSGGVDSTALLWAAEQVRSAQGGRVSALTTISASMPDGDLQDAKQLAETLGVRHILEQSREIENPLYVQNDPLRCYYCKSELFDIARRVAGENDLKWIIYGYNASDHSDDRPGHRAAVEGGVRSPLSECGLEKDEIRKILAGAGLTVSEKPASPCLSSRVMHGIKITPRILNDVARLENIIAAAGIEVFRVRVCSSEKGHFIRVEVGAADMPAILEIREDLIREARLLNYLWVTLDLEPYRTGGGTFSGEKGKGALRDN